MICTIIAIIISITYSKACVEWTILNSPIVFGETARLSCIIESKRGNSSTRTWFGGQNFSVLSFNGVSANPAKYTEILQWRDGKFESILEIKQFQEHDVNCDYSCSAGHHENRKKMLLTMDNFELRPKKSDVTVFSVLREGNLDVFLNIGKVYPIPTCIIDFNGQVINTHMNKDVEKTGIFYRITQQLEHTFQTAVCIGKLEIHCKVGNTDLKIHQASLKTCIDPKVKDSSKQKNYSMIGAILGGIILLLIAVIALVGLSKYGKLKNLILCNVNYKGEDRPNETQLISVFNELKDLLNSKVPNDDGQSENAGMIQQNSGNTK